MTATAVASDRYNASLLLDRNVEAGRGHKPAYIAADGTLTYDALRRQVNRAGHYLRELGVRREDRVLLVLDDTTPFPIFFLGAMRIGAVPVPVSPLDKNENYRHYAEDSYAAVAVCDQNLVPRLREAMAGLEVRFVARNAPDPDVLDLDAGLAAQSDELDAFPAHRDDMAFWLYSSGSTGKPKGVVHLQHDIGLTCEHFAGEVLGLREDDVVLSTTKLFHAYGLGNGLSFPLWFGATTVLNQGPTKPERILERLRANRPTVFCSVPALYGAIVRHPDADGALDSVRLCVSAAEALPPQTFDRWEERFGLEIVDGIGSTEMLHIFISNRLGDSKAACTGRPLAGYQAIVVDNDMREVPPGVVGRLAVKGPIGCRYLADDRQGDYVRDGWNLTGDSFIRDADGYFHFAARSDDMIVSAGYNIAGPEVEAALLKHEAVAECAVIGVPDTERGHIVEAHVVLTDGNVASDAMAKRLQEHVKSIIAPYKYPRSIIFAETLPKTESGKIQRFRLKQARAA
jgi:2-aminobenzoate-CoA ligase